MNTTAWGQTWTPPATGKTGTTRRVDALSHSTKPHEPEPMSEYDRLASVLKAMGHPLRLRILCMLAGGEEISVQDLVERVGTTQSNVSQHLSLLRDAGVICARRDATRVYYRLAAQEFERLLTLLRQGADDSRAARPDTRLTGLSAGSPR